MADRESTGRSRTAEAGTKRMPPWLRRVGVIVIFLLAGAIINVLVAWGCAYWSLGWALHGDNVDIFDPLEVSEHERAWLARRGLREGVDTRWTFGETHGVGITRRGYYLIARSYFRDSNGPMGGGSYWADLAIIDAGWPFKSLRAYEREHADWELGAIITEFECAIVVDRTMDMGGPINMERALPLQPIPFAFLANSVMFGAALWLIPFGPRAIRRLRRRKRNLCPDCGYDLRGADHGKCPECGIRVHRN